MSDQPTYAELKADCERAVDYWKSSNAEYEARIAHLEARVAAADKLAEALEWYRGQMCEGFCADYKTEEYYAESMDFHCAGCKARAAVAAYEASEASKEQSDG